MTDRNVQWPNRYQLTKVPGTDDIYDLTPAPGTITAEGTMINKASLLTDETAQAYGFTEEELADVVPDDVLALLATKNIQVEYTEITESTNWTAPENLASNTAFALLVGGGGGGYGGGGGSGYVTLSQVSLTPGQSYQAVIGAGGNRYFTSSSPQTDGGTTTFAGLSALGGKAGGERNGGDGMAGGGGGNGGNGGNGSVYGGGGGGGNGTNAGDGGDGGTYGGGGGGGTGTGTSSSNRGRGGSGGTYGGDGGDGAYNATGQYPQNGTAGAPYASFSGALGLFGLFCGATAGPSAAGLANSGSRSYGGGGGGGYGSSGGNHGGGGGGYFGNGGTGRDGGGGGGGLFYSVPEREDSSAWGGGGYSPNNYGGGGSSNGNGISGVVALIYFVNFSGGIA